MLKRLRGIMNSHSICHQSKSVILETKISPSKHKVSSTNIKLRPQTHSKHARETSRRPEFTLKLPSKRKGVALQHKFCPQIIKLRPPNIDSLSKSIKARPRNIKFHTQTRSKHV